MVTHLGVSSGSVLRTINPIMTILKIKHSDFNQPTFHENDRGAIVGRSIYRQSWYYLHPAHAALHTPIVLA
jgi:hypothetical protein